MARGRQLQCATTIPQNLAQTRTSIPLTENNTRASATSNKPSLSNLLTHIF